MKGKRSPGAGLFDKLLVPRLENYACNNDVTDIEAACDYLRRCYKEYQRQKLPALRQQVERAVDVIARKGGVTKSELRLQVGARRSRCRSTPCMRRMRTADAATAAQQPAEQVAVLCVCMQGPVRGLQSHLEAAVLLNSAVALSPCPAPHRRKQAAERQHVSRQSRSKGQGGSTTTGGGGAGNTSASSDSSGSSDSEGEGSEAGSSDLELDADAPGLQADSQQQALTPGTGKQAGCAQHGVAAVPCLFTRVPRSCRWGEGSLLIQQG